jgi:hypothetical protein
MGIDRTRPPNDRQRRRLIATTTIRLFYEASTANRALDAVAAGFPRDELNLITHQECVDIPDAMSALAPRLVTVAGVSPIFVIGLVAAVLSGTAGEVAGGACYTS